MNQLQTFNHQIFGDLPAMVVDEVEWFGATEAAKSLSFSNPYKAIDNHVENEDCTVHTVLTNGGKQQKKFINESGLYSLIFGAAKQGNNPEIKKVAKEYKHWVTSEVLPIIRKTGGYVQEKRAIDFVNIWIPQVDEFSRKAIASTLESNRQLLTENKTLKTTIEEQKPKVVYAEAVTVSEDTVLIKDVANTLKQKGIDIGEKRLFKWMRDNEFLCKKKGDMWNMPTQKSLDMDLIAVRHGLRTGSNGEMKKTRTPKITGKGQIYFVNKILSEFVDFSEAR